MRVYRLLALVVVAGMVAGSSAAEDPPAGSTLAALEKDIQNLHEQINGTLVRVSVTQSAAAVLDGVGLKAEFGSWTPPAAPPAGGAPPGGGRRGGDGTRGAGPDRGQTRPTTNGSGTPPFGAGFAGRGPGGESGGLTGRVRSFLDDRVKQLAKSDRKSDKDEADKLRALMLRIDLNRGVFQGEMSAALLDNKGNAIILTGLLREAHTATNPMHVTLPDGTQTNAAFVGANLYGNYTVVKLDNFKGTVPVKWSARKVAPGDLLMTTTAGPGTGALIVAPGKPGETLSDDRLTLPAEDRSGMFVHDVRGALVAVMASGGGLGGERFATTAARMQREIDYIIREGKDIEPRSLGLEFTTIPATATLPRSVQVKGVAAKSLAEAAMLKTGDVLISIDGHPVSELVSVENRETTGMTQLKVDLVTRTTPVPLIVKRDGKDISLAIPLK